MNANGLDLMKAPPSGDAAERLRLLDGLRTMIAGTADGVVFVDARGQRAEAGEADFVLLTRDRFTELACGRLLDLSQSPSTGDVVAELRRVHAQQDMATALSSDPLGPVKLGRKERRAEDRRRRRRGGR